jgi:hypothetical protein
MNFQMIPFTQYLRPNGTKRATGIEASPELSAKAQAIIDAGFRFECEVLSNGYVHLTISNDQDDHARIICQNGPQVPQAVNRLVTNFFNRLPKP